jgi:hypothetical protein
MTAEPRKSFTHYLYSLRNVWLPDGTWVGQFIDADTAKEWLKAKGYDPKECEISDRKIERKSRIS